MDRPKIKRTRKGGPKSRNGCLTCKIRHVKCDEARPSCHGCVSTGRKCDGYSSDDKKKNKELIFAPPITVSRPLPQILYSLNQKEAQHLNHFRHVFARGMAGYVLTPVWEKSVLQAVHEEPAVRLAAIAFTALQSPPSLSPSKLDRSNLVFALRQYSASIKALQQLLTQKTPRAIKAALICSVICTAFEILEGSHLLAQGHFEHSLQLISANEKMIDEDISRTFARLDVQASTYLGHRTPIMVPRPAPEGLEVFFDLKGAEDALFRDLNDTWNFIYRYATPCRYLDQNSMPPSVLDKLRILTQRLSNWKTAFIAFVHTYRSSFSERDTEHANLLEIHHCTGTVLLAGEISAYETIYDMFDNEFQSIVSLSSELLRKRLVSLWGDSFSIEMGIIQPLYITAIKCRVSDIRAAAIELLSSVPRPEGIWNGQIMSKIADKVRQMEEMDIDAVTLSFERPPESCRIHSVSSDIDPQARIAKFVCDKGQGNENGVLERRHCTVTW